MAAPTITLKPFGQKIAQVGFGLWKVSSAINKASSTVLTIIVQVPNDSTADVVYKAIENGYRHFDGACDYGMFPNEHAEPDVG
jgi:D-xylose reductase